MRFFADECIIYRKILNIKNVEKLQTDMNIMGDWAEGNEIKINHENPGEGSDILFHCGRIDS